MFHNACLLRITQFYSTKIPGLRIEIIWTDNCGGQYKCKQNFFKIATFSERHTGVAAVHHYAQKYHKNTTSRVWDGAGKVIKTHLRKKEDSQQGRFPDAKTCFLECVENLSHVDSKDRDPWEENKDPRIVDEGDFVASKRYFGYATEKKEEYE